MPGADRLIAAIRQADARGRVHLWHDQSENQNDASQPCAAMEPLLAFPPPLAGRPALRFDGLLVASKTGRGVERISFGTYLQSDGQVDIPGAMTSFCVHRVAAPSAPEHVLWAVGQPNIWGEMRLDMTRDDVIHFETWSYDADTGFKTKAGGFRIRADRMPAGLNSVEIIDTSAEGAVEFTRTLTGTKAPLPGYFVGGLDPAETFGRNFDGDIAEILIYQGALDDVDLRAVNDYLQDKYLPATRLEGASLQWLFNGVNIAGATNVTLVLTNVRSAMSGAYSIMVSNAAGAAQSSNALVSVKNP